MILTFYFMVIFGSGWLETGMISSYFKRTVYYPLRTTFPNLSKSRNIYFYGEIACLFAGMGLEKLHHTQDVSGAAKGKE